MKASGLNLVLGKQVQTTAQGNFQPFNASGNIYQITRLKRQHNTLCGHLEGGISLLLPENVFD
jgi:hypothetical protein